MKPCLLLRTLLTLIGFSSLFLAPFSDALAVRSYEVGKLVIQDPWTRQVPSGAKTGAGYFTVTNHGKAMDYLIGGTSEFSGTVEVHQMEMVDGVMKMSEIPGGLPIPPGKTVVLKPGGWHLMFIELIREIKEGEKLKGTLLFREGGRVVVEFVVGKIGSKTPPGERR